MPAQGLRRGRLALVGRRHERAILSWHNCIQDACDTNQAGEIAMTSDNEAKRAGQRSLAIWALASVVLLILGTLFANGTIGGQKAAAPPQSSSVPAGSEAPAGSQNP